MKKITKKVLTMLLTAAMLMSVLPLGISAGATVDSAHNARNFMALDNGAFWNWYQQVSWINPEASLSKVSLYHINNGSEELIADNTTTPSDDKFYGSSNPVNTTSGAKIVVRPASNIVGRDVKTHVFKLVCEYADGESSVQYTTGDVNYLNEDESGYNNIWNVTVHAGDWSLIRNRGGYKYYNANDEMFPERFAVEYNRNNPYLNLYSNADLDDYDLYGNYFGVLQQNINVERGVTYNISFDYMGTDGYNVQAVTMLNGAWNGYTLADSNTALPSEWTHCSYSVTAGTSESESYIQFVLKGQNEAFKIDNIKIVKDGTDDNLIKDGDFSNVAAMQTAECDEATAVIANDGTVTVNFGAVANESAISRVRVYEKFDDKNVLLAELPYSTYKTFIINNADVQKTHTYVISTENSIGVESKGIEITAVDADKVKVPAHQAVANDLRALNGGFDGRIMILWRNANYNEIKSVSITDENGAVVAQSNTDDPVSTAANAVNRFIVANCSENTFYSFNLVTELENGQKFTQPVCGTYYADDGIAQNGGYTYSLGGSSMFSITEKIENNPQRLTERSAEIDNTDAASGQHSLKIINGSKNDWDNGLFLDSAADVLEANSTYKVTFMVKGSLYAWQKLYAWNSGEGGGSNLVIDLESTDVTYDNWTEKSYTFTTGDESSAHYRGITFTIQNNAGDFAIDDIKLEKLTSDGAVEKVVLNEGFENCDKNESTVENLKAIAKDGKAVLSWTAPGVDDGTTKVVRLYAKKGVNKYLIGTVSPLKSGIEIDELENNKEYTFYAETIKENGAISDARTVSVTPVPDPYRVSKITLMDNTETAIVPGQLKAGAYKAESDVKNNSAGENFTAELIVCLYDGATLIDAKTTGAVKITQSAENLEPTTLTTPEITVPNTDGHDYKIKTYLWNSLGGMKPLVQSETF